MPSCPTAIRSYEEGSVARRSGSGGADVELVHSGEATEGEVLVCREFFQDPRKTSNDLAIQEHEVDFGACSRMATPARKEIHLTNNTNGKVICVWNIPRSGDGDEELEGRVVARAAGAAE